MISSGRWEGAVATQNHYAGFINAKKIPAHFIR